jgi:hypothetical protein
LTIRVPESEVEFLSDSREAAEIPARELAMVDHADQLIVLDRSPLARELAIHLLARIHVRPNLKVVLVTDPGNEAFGGTPAGYLKSLEAAGILVARVRLDRLRDSNPLYSGLWRLGMAWWSDPFDEIPGQLTLPTLARSLNFKSDTRQLMIADDGAGGWTSLIASAGDGAGGSSGANAAGAAAASAGLSNRAALVIRGSPAHDIAAGELHIAAWSMDDDRLPSPPPIGGRGVGSIDVRFLTEGAILSGLLDIIGAANGNDQILIATQHLSERRLMAALLRAAARGVRLQVLLDPNRLPNQAAAAELIADGAGHAEVHWQPVDRGSLLTNLLIVRHRNDVWLNLGSATFTGRNLGDLNLSSGVELRMPARTATARAACDYFARTWALARPYAEFSDDSTAAYWHYRWAEATGLSRF